MRFNWQSFLEQRRIDYVTSGSNTKKGNLNIKCPFCGESDPSQHLGINPKFGFWGCLRNAAHRGKSPIRLVRQLLHCSEEEARRIVGVVDMLTPTTDALLDSFKALRAQANTIHSHSKDLKLPSEFKPLLNGSVLAQPFISYLEDRGFRTAQIKWLTEAYKLHYATQGQYAYRIIVPVFDRYGDLLTWTARSIQPNARLRYKTLRARSDDADGPVAKLAVNGTVLGLPLLWGAPNAKALIIVEGPFDALKITAFGNTFGVYATALFGLNIYPSQIEELHELSTTRYDRVYLLLDSGTEFQKLRLLSSLDVLGAKTLVVPSNRKDPGDMSGAEVVNFCLDL